MAESGPLWTSDGTPKSVWSSFKTLRLTCLPEEMDALMTTLAARAGVRLKLGAHPNMEEPGP